MYDVEVDGPTQALRRRIEKARPAVLKPGGAQLDTLAGGSGRLHA